MAFRETLRIPAGPTGKYFFLPESLAEACARIAMLRTKLESFAGSKERTERRFALGMLSEGYFREWESSHNTALTGTRLELAALEAWHREVTRRAEAQAYVDLFNDNEVLRSQLSEAKAKLAVFTTQEVTK